MAIRPEFSVHILNDDGIAKAKELAEIFSDTLNKIDAIIRGPSRSKSLVITHLEDASYRAKRAMAEDPANQK